MQKNSPLNRRNDTKSEEEAANIQKDLAKSVAAEEGWRKLLKIVLVHFRQQSESV